MCNWHKPVCVVCKIDMYPEKNGVQFVEQYNDGNGMKPYKIWESDMWTCPSCGVSVLVGFGSKPTAICYDETFDETFDTALTRAREDHWTIIEGERP